MNRFDKRRSYGHAPGRERTEAVSPHPGAPRLVVGLQPVREAIRVQGARLGSVLVEQTTGDAAGRLEAIARFAESQQARVERVTRKDLDLLSGSAFHQGAAAWAPSLTLISAADVVSRPDLLAVALDGIQDPQNFGAVVRSTVALGGTAIVWPENASAPLTPATFRASAGAVEHAALCRVPSLVRFLDEAVSAGAQTVGLTADAPHVLHEVDLRGPTVLVIGGEHDGLGRAVRSRCTALARLTLRGPIDSLNASAACAAALYTVLIQRAAPIRDVSNNIQ